MPIPRSLLAAGLGVVRRGRPVAWTPEFMNLGNLLTLGLWAYAGDRDGEERRVLLHPARAAGVGIFPTLLERYFVGRGEVRFTDRRVRPWTGHPGDRPSWDAYVGYTREVLLPGSPVADRPGGLDGTLVVNVRRGDYYTVREHFLGFGFDIVGYVRAALDHAVADDGVPQRVLVVSDDPSWCREHLAPVVGDLAPVTYTPGGDPARDLALLVHAERLVLANSTFSYWGGFAGDALHGPRAVYVPWLFDRRVDGGSCRSQVRAEWTVVEDLPGGWALPTAPGTGLVG